MPSSLIPSSGCCTSSGGTTVVVNTPGPIGPSGNNGTNGVNGTPSTSTSTASFTVPASNANGTITLADATFVPQIANSALVYLAIGNAGYFEIVSKAGNVVTVKNPSVISATNAAPGTVIATGAVVSLAGPRGASGAAAANAAPDSATFILQTANGSLGSAQALSALASGFVKVTTATGVLSSVSAIPVADVSGNWSLASVTGTLAAANGGTGNSSYAIGDVLYASGATALSKLAGVATGNVLISGGVATAPAWGKVGLTTHVSGTLPIANGGTGVTAFSYVAAYAAGSQTISATSSAVVLFGTEVFDTGSTFNAGTGVWTPAIVGYVHIDATVLGKFSGSGTERIKLSVRKNGTVLYTKVFDWVNHAIDISCSISGLFYSAANTDTFDIHLENLNSQSFTLTNTAQGTYFFGRVIGA